MHKEAAARITRRTVDQLEKLAATVAPLSYDVHDWATLGFCDGLIAVDDADAPTDRDVRTVGEAIAAAVAAVRSGPTDLSRRLDSDEATRTRAASRAVRDTLARQWNEH